MEYARLNTAKKKEFWRENPLNGDIDIDIPGLPKLKMRCENDDTVVKELHWTGFTGWELTSLKLWSGLLEAMEPGVVLDIGCYSGIYALLAGKSPAATEIHAFDIQERCLARLKVNVAMNDGAITCHLAACVDRAGEADFYYYEEEGILSSVASVVPKQMNDRSARVPTVRLDDVLRGGSAVRLVKIDVEGAEQLTLEGLRETIARDQPDFLIEINDQTGVSAAKSHFPKAYGCYCIDDTSPRIRQMRFLSRSYPKARNYLFTPRPRAQLNAFIAR